jgi:TolB-like protein/DNA-binding winged helix-turn-helix (wHTH) protein/Flp pilus assembly protein TadD
MQLQEVPGSGHAAPPLQRWQIGRFELDEAHRELRADGCVIPLEPKPLNMLMLLLRRPGQVVTKEELIDTLWGGRIVTDSVITRCAAKLRQALGDDGQLIKTVHGYGYRFMGEAVPVELRQPLPSAPEPEPAAGLPAAAPVAPPAVRPELLDPLPLSATQMFLLRWAPVIVGLFLAVTLSLWQWLRPPVLTPASVAVLPFAVMGAEAEAEEAAYLADGIQESILTHLAKVGDLKVISRTSVMQYRDAEQDLREIGRRLGVSHILEGSVQRADNRLRVQAQLIEVATDHHVWAESYDREISDLLAIQSEVAERVAHSVGVHVSDAERAAIRQLATRNDSAYDLYLRARVHERTDITSREQLYRAQALLERAVVEDPQFALAHAALSRVHSMLYWFAYDPAAERRDRARVAVERALALEPGLAEAHMSLGIYRAAGFRDYAGALEAYQKALQLQPNSAEVHRYVGSAWRRQGSWEEAVTSLKRAVELDPANIAIVEDLAGLYRGLRRYEEAAPLFERVRELAPDDGFRRLTHAQFMLDWKGSLEPLRKALAELPPNAVQQDHMALYYHYLLAFWEGRYADAVQHLQAFPSDWLISAGGAGRNPKEVSLGLVHHMAGQTRQAQQYFRRARSLLEGEIRARPNDAGQHMGMGIALAGLGEAEAARQSAQRALDLMPASLDPVAHADLATEATIIAVLTGDHERAVSDLNRLMNMAYGPSANTLRILPFWKPLQQDPRFKTLVAAYQS